MPYPHQYPTAWVQLRELAVDARLRGCAFDEFWEAAVRPGLPPLTWRKPDDWLPGTVVWANDAKIRQDDRAAILATRAQWERAYYGISFPGGRGISYLASMMERVRVDPVRGEVAGEAVRSAA